MAKQYLRADTTQTPNDQVKNEKGKHKKGKLV